MKEGENFYITARTRKQRMDASKSDQELNREVKRSCRRDNRVYVSQRLRGLRRLERGAI